MGAFRSFVERWRKIVEAEHARLNTDLSPNWTLALIQQESSGKVGSVADVRSGDGSYCSGLMQVQKTVLDDYNKSHSTKWPWATMTAKTDAAAQLQVRVGLALIVKRQGLVRTYLEKHGADSDDPQVMRIADTAYAMGWGATQKKLEGLRENGHPLTFEQLEAQYPSWGRVTRKDKVTGKAYQVWVNRPLHHAKTIYSRFSTAEAEHPYSGPIPAGEDLVEKHAGELMGGSPVRTF